MAITDTERKEIVQEVLNEVKSASQSVDTLTKVTSLDGISSLPVMKGTSVVVVPTEVLFEPATTAASDAQNAASSATNAANAAAKSASSAQDAASAASESLATVTDAVSEHTAAVSIHPIAGVAENIYAEASDDYDPAGTGITYLQDEQRFVNVVEDTTDTAPTYDVDKGAYKTEGVGRNLLKRTNCGKGYGDTTASGFPRNGWVAYGYNASTGVNAVKITEGEIIQLGTNTRVGRYARFTHAQNVVCTSEYIAFPIRPDIIKAGEKYTVSLVVVD
ncbi:MAG: hypothetical protein LIO91_03795, partial [Bacteroidales bacterium]|nr:hypothetical protein [Bacteroidales bacterium]